MRRRRLGPLRPCWQARGKTARAGRPRAPGPGHLLRVPPLCLRLWQQHQLLVCRVPRSVFLGGGWSGPCDRSARGCDAAAGSPPPGGLRPIGNGHRPLPEHGESVSPNPAIVAGSVRDPGRPERFRAAGLRDFADYIDGLATQAAASGFKPGDPLVDLTGHYPGMLYLLGAKSIGAPWLIGGYPGSGKLAAAELGRVQRGPERAWILAEPAPTRLPTWVLTKTA